MRLVRIVHRWLGLLLLVWVSTGTYVTMPSVTEQTGAMGLAAIAGVFELEAEGGGPVNHPVTLGLIVIVATVGVTLLVDRWRRVRRVRMPHSALGWLYLVHRWLGAIFTISLVAYLTARLVGGTAPPALAWTWLLLLFAVNMLGGTLLIVWLVGAIRRRRSVRTRASSGV